MAFYGDATNRRLINELSKKVGDVDGLPLYVQSEYDKVENRVLTLLNDNFIVVGFSTDQHIDLERTPLKDSVTGGLKALKKLTNTIPYNLVVLGGDAVRSNITDSNKILRNVSYVSMCLSGAGCRVLHTTGNHDATQNNPNITEGLILKSHDTFSLYDGVVEVPSHCNYIYDDDRNKVRYIVIDDTARTGYTLNSIKSALTNALSTTPEGYEVIVFSHHPLNNSLGADWHNPLNCGSILETYKDIIICCICGHSHNSLSSTKNGILYVTTTTAGVDSVNDGTTRTYGKADCTAFDNYLIDRQNKLIYIVGYGASVDRTLSYGDTPVSNYWSVSDTTSTTQYSQSKLSEVDITDNNLALKLTGANSGITLNTSKTITPPTAGKTIRLECDNITSEYPDNTNLVCDCIFKNGDTVLTQFSFFGNNPSGERFKEMKNGIEKSVSSDLANTISTADNIAVLIRASGSLTDGEYNINITNMRVNVE